MARTGRPRPADAGDGFPLSKPELKEILMATAKKPAAKKPAAKKPAAKKKS